MIPLVTPLNEQAVRTFEQAFSDRVGAEWAIAVSSGTTALTTAIHALGLHGRNIRVPTYACDALQRATQGRCTYVDGNYNVRECQMTQDDADVIVHMFGRRTNHNHGHIEDYTLSLGAQIPLIRDLGVCSTHATKMISTGRGGIIFGNDPELHQRALELSQDVRMSPAQAQLGIGQLNQLPSIIEQRQHRAHQYNAAFGPAGIECPTYFTGSVFFRYIIAVDDPAQCVLQLANEGIECGRGVHPLLHQQVGQDDERFPGAVHAHNTNLSIPIHPAITNAQAKHIVEQVIHTCA